MKVLILSDGVPGHVHQARGLVHWLSKRYELVCSEQTVSLRARPAARVLLPYALKVRGIGTNVGKAFYRTRGLGDTPPDLIISAGGNTSFLNIALARKWSVPNVFLGSSRRLNSDDFAAHLTLEPTGEPHNIVMDLVPTGTDLSEQGRKGRMLRASLQLQAQQPLYSLIVGGDGSGFIYEEATWRHLGELVEGLSNRDDCRWLVTTSRRTGDAGEQLLRNELPQAVLADSVWWSNEPKKVMSSYLGAADVVFVTGDSMTMVNEAIASQKPTVVLAPDNAQPSERHRKALLRFQEAGYCNLHPLGSGVPSLPSNANKDDRAGDLVLSQLEKLIPSLQRFR
nr:ELM1/GtrOC1 family putative glycosyltransferase [Marinobacter salexigens]